MSLVCSCGCGKLIPDRECRVNRHGFLEIMRQECIDIGMGIRSDGMTEKVWDEWVMTLSPEEVILLDNIKEELPSGKATKDPV